MNRRASPDQPSREAARSSWLATVFALDVRSLAAMRIGLALVLLWNLYELVGEVPAFYTDSGVLSRADRLRLIVEEQFTAPPHWVSLHMLSGEAWFQYVLFAISAAFAGALLVGYRTPWALLGSWVLLVGLQARNPMPMHAGDDVLRCVLFWSLLLPLGAAWSVDGRRASAARPTHACSVASAAILIQLVCIYWFTALLKDHPVWRREFTALQYGLAMDHFTMPAGSALLKYPTLMKFLTAATLVLEFVGPLLLFVSRGFTWLRTLIFAAFVGLHLGIAATLDVGLFPYTCIAYWTVVLPSGFWDALAAAAGRLRGRAVAADRAAVRFAPTSFPGQALAATLLLGTLLLNDVRLANSIHVHLQPGPLRVLVDAAQLNQFWCMFAPRPHDCGGWYDLRGTSADGRQVNLLHPDRPPQDTRPANVWRTYPNGRWLKLLIGLVERECPTYRRGVGEYFRRRWNATHGPAEQLVSAEIVLHCRPIVIPGEPILGLSRAGRQVLWKWSAEDSPASYELTSTQAPLPSDAATASFQAKIGRAISGGDTVGRPD